VGAERVKGFAIAAIVAAAIALGVSFAALHRASRSEVRGQELVQRISGLLAERERLLGEFERQPGRTPLQDPLVDYLALIRRDGASMHAPMHRTLSHLAVNQLSLLTLADVFEPLARKKGYPGALRELRGYVFSWNDRWNGLFEIFMAGGNLAPQPGPFPQSFAEALRAEGASPD
jgi:hypothetical protein